MPVAASVWPDRFPGSRVGGTWWQHLQNVDGTSRGCGLRLGGGEQGWGNDGKQVWVSGVVGVRRETSTSPGVCEFGAQRFQLGRG